MATIMRLCLTICLVAILLGQPASAKAQLFDLYTHIEKVYQGFDFHPTSSEQSYSTWQGSITPKNTLSGGMMFTLPLILQRGAAIEELTFYFIDESVDGYLTFDMVSYDTTSYTSDTILSYSSSTVPVSDQVTWFKHSFTTPLSLSSDRAYQLRVMFDTSDGKEDFYGVRVKYRVLKLLPAGDTTFTVSGANFLRTSSNVGYEATTYGMYVTANNDPADYLYFPLDLPPNAQIKNVTYYYIDNGDQGIYLRLSTFDPENRTRSDPTFITLNNPPSNTVQVHQLDISDVPVHTGMQRYTLQYRPFATGMQYTLVGAKVTYSGSYNDQGVKVKTLVGMELTPTNTDNGFRSSNGELIPVGADWYYGYHRNLNLPDYRSISKITYYFIDNNPDEEIYMMVQVYPFPDSDATVVANLRTDPLGDATPDPRSVSTSGGGAGILNTALNTYRVRAAFTGNENLILSGVRVEYFYPHPAYLPTVLR